MARTNRQPALTPEEVERLIKIYQSVTLLAQRVELGREAREFNTLELFGDIAIRFNFGQPEERHRTALSLQRKVYTSKTLRRVVREFNLFLSDREFELMRLGEVRNETPESEPEPEVKRTKRARN